MKASELRIGNYLQDRQGLLCKVTMLEDCEERQVYAPSIKKAITHLPNKLIPLTEEWLWDLRYELNDRETRWVCNDIIDAPIIRFIESKDDNNFYFFKEPGFYTDGSDIYLPYVHSLQNAVFVYSGEELKIKDNE